MDILCARFVPAEKSFAAWDAEFALHWRGTEMMQMPALASRRFYFDRGYSPSRAVDICTDADPTNAT